MTRRLEDCRKLAVDHSWAVGDEYVDNDVSAYKGKPRPQYQRMLSDLAEGYRDAVIVYNMDRLTRHPMELEQFTRLCEQSGVAQVKSVTADLDLANDDGLFMARILAAIASRESGRTTPTQSPAAGGAGTTQRWPPPPIWIRAGPHDSERSRG